MRTVAHLSDLHFGRASAALARAVAEDVHRGSPDLVVVSGDLTQRATSREFREARAFLDDLPRPQVVVPGNHDIPLFDPLHRFLWPLRRWRRVVGEDLEPFHVDAELAVLGLNTARSFTWKNGRVSHEQILRLRRRLGSLGEHVFKVVVTHHPFLPPPGRESAAVVGRAQETMHALRDSGVDMILSGHYHMSHAAGTHRLYRVVRHSALVVQAGTATSDRTRAERNSWNLLTVDELHVTLGVRTYDGERFRTRTTVSYSRVDGEWTALSAPAEREIELGEAAEAADGGESAGGTRGTP